MPKSMKTEPAERLPDWKLPTGVDRALWEYLTTSAIADDYDEYFSATQLLTFDRDFLRQHFQKPGRLVDLGTGTGRLAIDFAQRGFEVTAVDLSRPMLAVTRRKAEEAGVSLTLIEGNICDLPSLASGSFDYAISMFSTLGMVVGVEARRQALREIHRLLSPGGEFALHVHNRWFNLFDPQGRRWLLGDIVRRWTGRSNPGDKVQVRYRGIPNLRIHLFSGRELSGELNRAGFQVVHWLPLAPDRRGGIENPGFASGFRANGWLVVARKEN